LPIAGLGKPPVDEALISDARETAQEQVINAHNADAVGSRSVSSVTPPPAPADASPVQSGDASDGSRRPFLTAAVSGAKTPSFLGMTLRSVLEEASARGFEVETAGAAQTGLVRDQSPAPGAVLPPGQRVRVQFAK
ncbi:MAG: PASTA domain-containing protein, partial [Acidobacteriia bacterium]|nr:PASTA domain-containing protein [Terriglobia bacterium]